MLNDTVDMMLVRVALHDDDARWLPERAHATDAAYDLKSRVDAVVKAGDTALIQTGVYLDLQPGWMAEIRPRSGLALKKHITIVNAPGTVDSDYRGEVGVILHNLSRYSTDDFHIKAGDRIAQMVIQRVPDTELTTVPMESLTKTDRGAGGYGSTGVS